MHKIVFFFWKKIIQKKKKYVPILLQTSYPKHTIFSIWPYRSYMKSFFNSLY